MQIGIITVGGRQVGVVNLESGSVADPFMPDLDGYVPEGRANGRSLGGPSSDHSSISHHAHHGAGHASPGEKSSQPPKTSAPTGENYQPSRTGSPFRQGSAETDRAIQEASAAHHLDPNFMRSVASIESSMNPSSNANRSTQYKGLYQIGHDEWRRFGNGGNIYSAQDNAMGGARLFDANRGQFRSHFGRDPTDAELYMMHQQGLGFYTRGAMTNIGGNPYPGMHGPQTHESFEAGWGHEVARRKAEAARLHPENVAPATGSRGAPLGEPDVPAGAGPQSGIPAPYQVATNVQDPNYTSDDIKDLIVERAKQGMPDTDTHKPGLLELDNTYNSPQQERENKPYAYPPLRDKNPAMEPQTDKDRKEPLPSQFYPPTPGDKEEYPARYNLHQDYHIGSNDDPNKKSG